MNQIDNMMKSLLEIYEPDEIKTLNLTEIKDLYEYSLPETINIDELANINDVGLTVDTPDGFQPITKFYDKGMHGTFKITLENKECLVSTKDHYYETNMGWVNISQFDDNTKIRCKSGFSGVKSIIPHEIQSIYDIEVDSEEHRYWSNEISSHNTGGGKTIFKCHMAAEYLKQGKNVMFFTMEMAAERIAERIDANMMKVKVDDIVNIGASTFIKKIDGIKSKTQGRLMIKEYPSTGAHSGHFRHFIRELKIKKKFEPDVIIVDYLNICASARVKSDSNSYTIIKAVAEELRGLGQEFGCRVWTSAQSNRGGYGNSELDLENVSESMGISHTADLFLALISNEELDAQGQILVKQLKNRYAALDVHRRFVLGLDKSKMTFYDIKDQGNIQSHTAVMKEDKPAFDNTKFGKKDAKSTGKQQSKQKFTF